MRRFSLMALLKDDPEIIRQYEEYHAHVWPEVLEGSYRCGMRRTLIYRHGRQLFMLMETVDDFDMQRDMPKYTENNPKAVEWNSMMTGFMEPLPGEPEGSTWVEMKELLAWDGEKWKN
jgi:L-rhamnose mutarotase